MPNPLLIDVSHTSHTRASTGIQRVVRGLYAALGERAAAVTFDPYHQVWRHIEPWETANLHGSPETAKKRRARWPLTRRLRSQIRRILKQRRALPVTTAGLVVPELFSSQVADALPRIFAATSGPRIALFHDAIALQRPEFAAAKTAARFPSYLQELCAFDGIAAVSEDSRDVLLDYWRWAQMPNVPPVRAIPLGIEITQATAPAIGLSSVREKPIILSVGSIEGRKNHLALLDACELLWSAGDTFTLQLVGLAQSETGQRALERLRSLQIAGRSLRYDGPADDVALASAYTGCAFTVYPSLMEGFGLPVLESLAHGKPCICSSRGALGESARGGGCIALDRMDASALAAAIKHLLSRPDERDRLAADAARRRFRTWDEYATELTTWMETLRSGAKAASVA